MNLEHADDLYKITDDMDLSLPDTDWCFGPEQGAALDKNSLDAKRAAAGQTAATKLKLTLDLADRIVDLRIERGWTQGDLGAKLRATGHFISELESAHISPTVLMLEVLAQVFGVVLTVELG